jgi:hypothetical protein
MLTANPVPALEIDAFLYRREPMPLRCRQERRVVWSLLHHLASNGWNPVLVFDGEEQVPLRDPKEVMELVFNLDESTVTFQKEGRRHGVLFVLGNSPEEVVGDYTIARDDADGFQAVMEGFDPEACL